MNRKFLELDDDPDEILAVLLSTHSRTTRRYAVASLNVAIRAGSYPRGWFPRG